MIKDAYFYFDLVEKLHYVFQSEGPNGKIYKRVIFSRVNSRRVWNLGFGDWKDGNLNDSIISNNNDIVKVIGTVAKITYEFFDNFPRRIIQIKPVDEKRKVLYNHVFRRHYEAINANFNIIGIKGRKKEKYSPNKIYDRFELNRKLDNEKE